MGKTEWPVNRLRDLLREIPTDRLPARIRPVLLLAATWADPDGSNVYPSARTLGEILGLPRSTVSGHLQMLNELKVLVNSGRRESWGRYAHTAVRYIDFAVLQTMTIDDLDRQATIETSDDPDRQASETKDENSRRMTKKGGSNDDPGRHNQKTISDQDVADDVSTSPTSPKRCPDCDRALAFKDGDHFCGCGYEQIGAA